MTSTLAVAGRYLVCGADTASLYLEVKEVSGPNAVCEALNDAVLDGLMTVFHIERSEDVLLNTQVGWAQCAAVAACKQRHGAC